MELKREQKTIPGWMCKIARQKSHIHPIFVQNKPIKKRLNFESETGLYRSEQGKSKSRKPSDIKGLQLQTSVKSRPPGILFREAKAGK